MKKKGFAEKLAAGVRQARQLAPAPPATKPAPPARRSAPAAPRRPAFARQEDQAPPASLDRPWDNLHPRRIWPD